MTVITDFFNRLSTIEHDTVGNQQTGPVLEGIGKGLAVVGIGLAIAGAIAEVLK